MDDLEQRLSKVRIEVPQHETEDTNVKDVPESYNTNNKKEKILLQFAENFQRQFRQLYGDRKTLFLKPPNEYGIPKFICTTLRPTQLPYKELYDYDGCAQFVSDCLSYVTLPVTNELPDKLFSPTTVLKQQKAGYDAYCVCGYATKQITLLDQTRNICPLLQSKEEDVPPDQEGQKSKYKVNPPKDLMSKFLKRQEQKEKDRIIAEGRKKHEEEEARIAELEKPPPDKYYGLRYHCWVLILAGKREIAQSFFIEPTTGETLPLDCEEYLGIETLWNHRNYWVNMQDCSQGVKHLVYDLGDATKWEYFFPNVDKPLLVVPGEEIETLEDEDDEDKDTESKKDHFQLPPSWVLPIVISAKDYETRCPNGIKTRLYQKAKLEKYSPYLNQDGLVLRLTTYLDTARTNTLQIKEGFLYRKDCLLQRTQQPRCGEIVDTFGPGRPGGLKEHKHYNNKSLKADYHTMTFYDEFRVDGLTKREITPTEMVEYYEKRPDRLYYRQVIYGKPVKRFEPAEKDRVKHIQKIVEKYHHNPVVPSNSDIAQCSFLLDERKINIVYHLEENRITPSTREFFVPVLSGENAQPLTMNPYMTSAYQVDPSIKEPKLRVLYETLEQLLKTQEDSIAAVRGSEKEMETTLSMRLQEELNTVLTISVYDVVRNETARQHRQELERKQAEEERIRQEKERDYLAPFLARIGDPPTLTREEKIKVRDECCQDLKTRLVEVANIIQSHFEKETDELQKKQTWYKQKQSSITREEEAEYVSYCADTMFRIHILEQRLNRHKTTAPQKYMELERRLKQDPRLIGI